MNTYRVDTVDQKAVPCGMNSIKYIGDSSAAAAKVFEETQPGFDAWGKPNALYGVIFSVWNGEKYVIKRMKGLDEK